MSFSAPFLAALAAGAAYSRVLAADGLVWDDRIVARWQLPRLHSLTDVFFPPAGIPNLEPLYYRPLVLLTYWSENSVAPVMSGAGLLLAHGTNIALHVIVTILFYFLARRLWAGASRGEWAALAAALLFALHPVHAEVVCAVSGRSDLLAALFVLGASLTALRLRDGANSLLAPLSAFSLLLGLLSKETALMGLAVVPAAWHFVPRTETDAPARKRGVYLGISFLVAAGAYLALREAAGNGYPVIGREPGGPAWGNILPALAFSVKQTILPWPPRPFLPGLPGTAASFGILLAAALGIRLLWKSADRRAATCLSAVWFVAFLAPPLLASLFSPATAPVAERFLYLPSAAACLLAGSLLLRGEYVRRVPWVLGLVGALFFVSSVQRAGAWRNDLTFWREVARDPISSSHPVALGNLAVAQRDAGQYQQARDDAERASQGFAHPKDRKKIQDLLASIDAAEGRELAARGDAKGAEEKADAAMKRLDAMVGGGFPPGAQARATLGIAFLAKARAAALRQEPPSALAAMAVRNLDMALKAYPGDPEYSAAREEALHLEQAH